MESVTGSTASMDEVRILLESLGEVKPGWKVMESNGRFVEAYAATRKAAGQDYTTVLLNVHEAASAVIFQVKHMRAGIAEMDANELPAIAFDLGKLETALIKASSGLAVLARTYGEGSHHADLLAIGNETVTRARKQILKAILDLEEPVDNQFAGLKSLIGQRTQALTELLKKRRSDG